MFLSQILLFSFASWGAWTPVVDHTHFECLPPIQVDNFDGHLRAGKLENAFPWNSISGLKVNPESRLSFHQRVDFEFVFGEFFSLEGPETFHRLGADALSGSKMMVNMIKNAPTRNRPPIEPFVKRLMALSEKDTHLFRIQPSDFEGKIGSKIFGDLLVPGTLIFSHESGALILSDDRNRVSICAKVDEYRALEERVNWLDLEQSNFEAQKISKIAFHFAHDEAVIQILQCEELFVSR